MDENKPNIPTLEELVELSPDIELKDLVKTAKGTAALSAEGRSALKRKILIKLTRALNKQIALQTDYVLSKIRPEVEAAVRKRTLKELGKAVKEHFPD